MLLRHRVPPIAKRPPEPASDFRHLDKSAIALLRWLLDNRVDFVLVGPVARQVRGDPTARGPVSIVFAPYGRNIDRLARALTAAHARLRHDVGEGEGQAGADATPLRVAGERLLRPDRWTLRCGAHDLDIEGHPPDGPRYQELLFEASRFELAPGLAVEVASPEDIEHYDHVRRTGVAPEIRITRQ
jgi:hypothetical protein